MPQAIEESPADVKARIDVLDDVVMSFPEPHGVNCADALGIDDTTLNNYLAGRRGFGWHVIVQLCRWIGRRHPERIAKLGSAMLRRLFGRRVRVHLDQPANDERGLGDRALELGDLVGDVHREVRSALADGKLEPHEVAAVHRRAEAALTVLAELVAATAAGSPATLEAK